MLLRGTVHHLLLAGIARIRAWRVVGLSRVASHWVSERPSAELRTQVVELFRERLPGSMKPAHMTHS